METKGIIGQGIFAVVTGVISFVGALFWAHRKQKQDRAVTVDVATAARDARISELENKLSLLTQSVMPISAAFQAILIKQLTHFHLPEIDALLAKVGPPVSLTSAEEHQLADALQQRAKDMNDKIDDDERGAAIILPYIIQRVRREAAQPLDLEKTDVVVVAVPKAYE